MKYTNFIILFIFFYSCQNQSETKQPSSTAEIEKPLQWIDYEGDKNNYKKMKIVLVSGDEEYRSEEVLPQLAKNLAKNHGFDCSVLFAQNPDNPGIIDPNYTNNIPGLESLEEADLLILFTRFRELPDEQMHYFQDYLLACQQHRQPPIHQK